jgi:hypothetical protein
LNVRKGGNVSGPNSVGRDGQLLDARHALVARRALVADKRWGIE